MGMVPVWSGSPKKEDGFIYFKSLIQNLKALSGFSDWPVFMGMVPVGRGTLLRI